MPGVKQNPLRTLGRHVTRQPVGRRGDAYIAAPSLLQSLAQALGESLVVGDNPGGTVRHYLPSWEMSAADPAKLGPANDAVDRPVEYKLSTLPSLTGEVGESRNWQDFVLAFPKVGIAMWKSGGDPFLSGERKNGPAASRLGRLLPRIGGMRLQFCGHRSCFSSPLLLKSSREIPRGVAD